MLNLGPGPLKDPTWASVSVLLKKYEIPDRLLEKRASDLLAPPAIAGAFADRDRTYPIHTAAAAWASAAAYHDGRSTDLDVAKRIKDACDWFGISSEWDRLEKLRPAEVQAPTTQKWALPDAARYPLDDERQVKAAVNYFNRYGARLPAGDRRTFAHSLVKVAGDHPTVLQGQQLWRLEAEAGLGQAHPDWRTEIDWRRKRALDRGDKGLAEALEKAAGDVKIDTGGNGRGGVLTREMGTFRNAGELAELLKQADRRYGWNHGEPIEGLVGETPSTARAKLAGTVKAASGDLYCLSDLDQVPDHVCADVAGMGLIVSRQAKAEKLASSADFERLVRKQGVQPIERARRRVDWKSLAAS